MSEKQSSDGEGTLAPGVLPRLLRRVYVGRKHGVLHVTRGEERGSIRFHNGSIVSGGGIIRECLMGETFVRHDLLSQQQLDDTLEAASETGRRFGQVAVDLGFLDQDALDKGLALHVRDILLNVFAWSEGTYAFEEEDPAAAPALDKPLRLSTPEVIVDAVWSIADAEIVRGALGDLDRIMVPAQNSLVISQEITLTPTDGFLLSRADGTLTARENLESCPGDREEAERGLLALLCTGMVDFESEPSAHREPEPEEPVRRAILDAHASLASQNHFEVMGLSRDSTEAAVKAAYSRLVKIFHPDAHRDLAEANLQDKRDAVFLRVTEAYRVLSDAKSRAAYEDTLPSTPSPEAASSPSPDPPIGHEGVAQALARAQKEFASGRHPEAFRIADDVLAGAEGEIRRQARILKARVYLLDSSRRKEAEEELRAAVWEDRDNAEAYYLLGTLYKAGGTETRARSMFRRALALEPRHPGALEELEEMDVLEAATEEVPQEGFFKRLIHRS